jgi:two-component system OmpR family response regulator
VVLADTGRKALEAAKKETPLLVILDLMLPDTSGEQVIQELQELGDVPVIILTSKSSEEDRVVGFARGADDYVVKPFRPRELVFRVKAVLKRAHRDDLATTMR